MPTEKTQLKNKQNKEQPEPKTNTKQKTTTNQNKKGGVISWSVQQCR